MSKEKRVKELLFYLSNNKDFVEADEIASLLKVSTKTVYRLVRDINAMNETPIIISKRGMGYKLISSSYLSNDNSEAKNVEIKS